METEKSVIRQGGPKTPYILLIAMTTMLDDMKHGKTTEKEPINNRPAGAEFDEILYAGDTILASENALAIEKDPHQIEIESSK